MEDDKNQNNLNETSDKPDALPDNGRAYNQYLDPEYQQKKKKKKTLITTILVVAALVLIAVTATLAISISSDQNQKAADGADIDVTVKDCELDEACFNDYFLLCQPTEFTSTETDGSRIKFEVSGIQEAGCLTNIHYLDSPDEDIVDKEMTCDFDNELGFRSSLSMVNDYPEDYECTGSLIDHYNSVTNEINTTYGI